MDTKYLEDLMVILCRSQLAGSLLLVSECSNDEIANIYAEALEGMATELKDLVAAHGK